MNVCLSFFFFLNFIFKYNNTIKKELEYKAKVLICQVQTKLNTEARENRNNGKLKETAEQTRNIFGVDGEEAAGLVGNDCQRHSKVEIGIGESDLRTREAAWWERR